MGEGRQLPHSIPLLTGPKVVSKEIHFSLVMVGPTGSYAVVVDKTPEHGQVECVLRTTQRVRQA